MNLGKLILLGSLLLGTASPLLSQTAKPTPASAQKPATPTAHTGQERDGQTVFTQNCERCHNAPQGFAPSISGTVIRHMRVRANLSKADEDALMHFLNP
jgi:cytochrome c5